MDCTLKVERVDGKTLRISGTCVAPTPHYLLELEPTNGGINPTPERVYLALKDTKPEGPVQEVLTDTPVCYVDQLSNEKTEVEIRGAEPAVIQIV